MGPIKDENERRRWKLFNGPQHDPTRLARRAGVPHYARRSITRDGGRVLMPDDFMPVGEHSSKHLRAVPADYLAWVESQPWSKHWPAWQPVSDYLSRFPLEELGTKNEAPGTSVPLFFLGSPLQVSPSSGLKVFSWLATTPGHEDLLHAFTVGALDLSRDYYQPGALPHYDLTVGKHNQALKHPCVQLIEDRQMIEHKDLWLQFYRSKPRPA